MRLNRFENFIYLKKLNESKNDIDSLCKKYRIDNYTINDDGSIDVNGNVDLSSKKLMKLPLTFKHVSGNFYCENNQLTTLEGSPKTVGGYFYCNNNQLTSLEGSPNSVGGSFWCNSNQLTTLSGSPRTVGGNFWCHNNQLRDVNGFPERFYGEEIDINNNPVKEIFDIFPEEKWVELPECLNEYEVIKGKWIIFLGLEECFYDLGLEVPPEGLENKKFNNYEIR